MEALFVSALVAVLAAISVPQTLTMIERGRASAAARYLASRMMLARVQAIGGGAAVALRFSATPRGLAFDSVVDGNGDGVRARDIEDGSDPRVEPAILLEDQFPGVAIAVTPGTERAVALGGSSELMTFTPSGTATPGSVYIRGRDGSAFVVRVAGATGRTRVLHYDVSVADYIE